MSQGSFFLLLILVLTGLVVGAAIAFTPEPELGDQCRAAGGELVAVRAGRPLCVRRDALIEMP